MSFENPEKYLILALIIYAKESFTIDLIWVFVEIGVSVHLDNIILVKRRPGVLVTPSN